MIYVLIAEDDYQNPGADHAGHRLAMLRKATRKAVGEATTPINHRREHDAAT